MQRTGDAAGKPAITARLYPKQTGSLHDVHTVQASAQTTCIAFVIGSRSGVLGSRIGVRRSVSAGRWLDGADVCGHVAPELVGGS